MNKNYYGISTEDFMEATKDLIDKHKVTYEQLRDEHGLDWSKAETLKLSDEDRDIVLGFIKSSVDIP